MTRSRKGFTLIELIVVIVIIAVLAAIGAVAYNQFVADSHTASLQASATRIRDAIDAASAKADVSPQQQVATLWTTAGDDSGKFLTSLSVSYDGSVQFTPAAEDGSTPATLQVDTAHGGSQTACLTLPGTVAEPVTIAAGACVTGPVAKVTVADTFNRANSTTSLGSTSSGQPWQVLQGVIGINDGTAYPVSPYSGSGNAIATVDLSSGEQDVEATLAGDHSAIVWRLSDTSNYWIAYGDSGSTTIQRIVSGSPTYPLTCPYVGDTKIHATGDTATLTVNGHVCGTVTDSFNENATKAGILWGWFASGTSHNIDNFTASGW